MWPLGQTGPVGYFVLLVGGARKEAVRARRQIRRQRARPGSCGLGPCSFRVPGGPYSAGPPKARISGLSNSTPTHLPGRSAAHCLETGNSSSSFRRRHTNRGSHNPSRSRRMAQIRNGRAGNGAHASRHVPSCHVLSSAHGPFPLKAPLPWRRGLCLLRRRYVSQGLSGCFPAPSGYLGWAQERPQRKPDWLPKAQRLPG